MLLDLAEAWVFARVTSLVDVKLRGYAVEDLEAYPGNVAPGAGGERATANFERFQAGGAIDSAECNKFAELVFGQLSNPSRDVDDAAPRVEQVSAKLRNGMAHNFVLVNRMPLVAPEPGAEIAVTAASPEFRLSIVVDGWLAAMGHPLAACVFRVNPGGVKWGSRIRIMRSWNPAIGKVGTQAGLVKTAHGLW